MRLAMVSETWAPDINGVAHTLHQLSQALIQRGVTLQLIRPRPFQPGSAAGMEHELQVTGFRAPTYPDVRLGMPARKALTRLWREAPPDAIYIATEGPLGWSALNLARRLGIPAVSGFHTNFDHYAGDYGLCWLEAPIRATLRYFHNRSQATLVPTEQRAAELREAGFKRVRVMGRGIDAEHFGPHKRDIELRRRWGVGAHQPVALHVGRIAQEKNLDLLVETFTAMQAVQPDLQPLVVGDGPQRAALEKRLPGTIFTGFIDNESLARHYASADLFVFPSRSETYGNVVAEAMASGLGIVAFDYAAAAMLIDHDRNGLKADFHDSAAFVAHAAALCRNSAQTAWLGRAARQRVERQAWSRVADDFLATLLQVQETVHGKPYSAGI
ncbi:MAG: glycosyltransferase family 1 protein [Pseudomonadota bacterium]|nr:glycosyltransferase family 1 protein [Pseudomonadota bacterium]